ncbi:hypothetical protein KCU93_g1831, partial [Aureobasidium melanogenum]
MNTAPTNITYYVTQSPPIIIPAPLNPLSSPIVGSSNSSKSRTWSTGIDLSIENLAGDGSPVTIHIHQPRNGLDQYHVTVNGVLVARATRFKAGAQTKFSSWQIEVAKGFDLALAFVIGRILAWHPLTRSWVKKEIRHSDDYKAQKAAAGASACT